MNALVEANVDLIGLIVNQTALNYPPHVDRDEIWQSGAWGLVFASRRFDESLAVPFRRFAAKHIKWAIINSARARDWAPRSVRVSVRELDQARSSCADQLRRSPSSTEVADHLSIGLDELHEIQRRAHVADLLSLDGADGLGDEELTLAEILADETAVVGSARVEHEELLQQLRASLCSLPPRHEIVVRGYWLEGRTSSALADLLGVTESRVSQLRTEALAMMRQRLDEVEVETITLEPRSIRSETAAELVAGR